MPSEPIPRSFRRALRSMGLPSGTSNLSTTGGYDLLDAPPRPLCPNPKMQKEAQRMRVESAAKHRRGKQIPPDTVRCQRNGTHAVHTPNPPHFVETQRVNTPLAITLQAGQERIGPVAIAAHQARIARRLPPYSAINKCCRDQSAARQRCLPAMGLRVSLNCAQRDLEGRPDQARHCLISLRFAEPSRDMVSCRPCGH